MILFLWCECICDVNWSFVGWSVFLRYVHAYKHIISYHITYYPMHEPVIILPYRACHLILHLPQHQQVYPSSTRLRPKHTYIRILAYTHTYIHKRSRRNVLRGFKCDFALYDDVMHNIYLYHTCKTCRRPSLLHVTEEFRCTYGVRDPH